MTIQEFIDMLSWFPVEKRKKNVFFETNEETDKTIKSVNYYPEQDYIYIEVE